MSDRWSAPVTHQVQGIGRNLHREFLPPLASYLPQKTVGTTPPPTGTDAQILWLPCGSNPLVADGVGVPADHNPCELYFEGRNSGQSDFLVV